MKKFLDCISIVGATPSKFHGTKKYISTGAVATTEIDESEVVEVTYEDRPSRANLSAEAGDILFAKMQGTRKLFFWIPKQRKIYIRQDFMP